MKSQSKALLSSHINLVRKSKWSKLYKSNRLYRQFNLPGQKLNQWLKLLHTSSVYCFINSFAACLSARFSFFIGKISWLLPPLSSVKDGNIYIIELLLSGNMQLWFVYLVLISFSPQQMFLLVTSYSFSVSSISLFFMFYCWNFPENPGALGTF